MPLSKYAALTATTALIATPAYAISPEEVWSSWQDFLTNSYAAEIEIGDEQKSGETLVVKDVTISTETIDGEFEVILSELRFENIGNGSVRITMPDEVPIASAMAFEEGETALMTMTMGQPGAEMIASGSIENTRYDFDYPTVTLGSFEFASPDMEDDELPVTLDMTLNALTGYIALSGTDVRTYESETDLASLIFAMAFSDAEGESGAEGAFNLTINDMTQVTTGAIGTIAPGASLSDMVSSGTSQDGRATHGAVTYSFEMDGPEGGFQMAAAAEDGELSATLDESGLSYGTTTRNVTATVAGTAMPLPPLSLSIEETGGLFQMPVVPGPDEQEFRLVTKILGMTADDMLWSLFDPAGMLPRDPAQLVIDITGSGVLINDFTDPEFAEDPENMEAPGELQSLTVNELLFSIAGAELAGVGDFAFSNDSGIPMPSGSATLSLEGGNQLIDTLVGMGLLPEEQAMGARMMLGLFARPDGEDRLVSEIEVTEDGQILANGQRIR